MAGGAGYYNARFLEVCAEAVVSRISEFNGQALANLAWAYEKLGFYHQGLLESVARQAFFLRHVR